mgnify:CR=1 FL=1
MKRVLIQLIAVVAIAAGAYLLWQALGEPAAQEEERSAAGAPVIPVAVAEARLGLVLHEVAAVGTTRAREAIEVVAPVSGRIVAIHFEEGEEVEEGRLLVELEKDREEAQLREAQAHLKDVASQLERALRLLRSQNVSQARVDELQAAHAAAEARVAAAEVAVRDREIRAPFRGVVGLREVSPGAFVQPQDRLTTLDDISMLRLDFSVPERFLARLRPGLPVRARSAAFPGELFEGRVVRIDSRIDRVTRSVRLQAELNNEARRLLPGMFMSVSLSVGETLNAVLVPESAIVNEGRLSYVFVVSENRAERREVEVGQRQRGDVQLLSGVAAGELVVTLGLQRVSDGAQVRIIDAPDLNV